MDHRRARAARRRMVVIGIAGLAALLPAATGHAADWLAPATLSDPVFELGTPDVLALPDGATLVAWRSLATGEVGGRDRIVVQRTAPDGTRGAAVVVYEEANPPEDQQQLVDVRVVALPGGAALVVWHESFAAAPPRVMAQRITPAGAADGPVTTFSGEVGSFIPALTVSAGPDDAVLAWIADLGTDRLIRVARIGAAGTPAAPQDIADQQNTNGSIDVGVAVDGEALVMWGYRTAMGGYNAVRVRRVSESGVPGALLEIDEGEPDPAQAEIEFPRIAVSVGGDAVVVAARRTGGSSAVGLWRFSRGASGLTALPPVPAPGVSGETIRVAGSPGGDVVAVWEDDDGATDRIEYLRLGVADATATVFDLDTGQGRANRPAVAVSDLGTAAILWEHDVAGLFEIRATTVAGEDPPSPTRVLSTPVATVDAGASLPSVAEAPRGEFIGAWVNDAGLGTGDPTDADQSVESAHFDATPPVVTAFIPAGATVETSVAFAVTAADRVDSQPLAFAWDFGDGGTSTLASPTHTFVTPGTRQASITVTDLAGNATTATAPVVVSTAPVPPVDPPVGGPAPVDSGPSTPATPTAPTPAPPAADTLAPALTALSLTPRRVVRGTPARTTPRLVIRFRLGETARVVVRVQRRSPGLRRARACVAPTPALRRVRARPCVRFVGVGSIVRPALAAGTRTVTIGRLRVGRRTLAPGAHRVLINAVDAAGNRSPALSRPLLVVRAPARG